MATFTDFLEGVVDGSWLGKVIINYNDYFNPNVCHVCKKTNNGDLILCDQCYMISYCCDLHILMDHTQHQKFCNYIKTYTRIMNGAKWRSIRLSTLEWIQTRYDFLDEMTARFSFSLELYEMQMILFAKSCYLCHQQINLQPCQACYSENYCIEHVEEFPYYHSSSKCKALKLCLNSNILNLDFRAFDREYIQFFDNIVPIEDMESFIMGYVRNCYHRNIQAWTRDEYIYSEYASGPLTLYDGMKKANLLNILNVEECVIHIISVGSVEKKYLSAWEILLHLLHRIKRLTIVLIAKNLEIEGFWLPNCSECVKRNQMFRYECHSMLYNYYMVSPSFRFPNVIVAFQAHFNGFMWSWRNTLLMSQCMNCPYFITAETQTIAEQNIRRIREILFLEPKYNAPNNFKSYIPCRLLCVDDVGYYNSYVTIYEHLISP